MILTMPRLYPVSTPRLKGRRMTGPPGRLARETRDVYSVGGERAGLRRTGRGRAAVEQARLIMLVMVNVAQLWILAATVVAPSVIVVIPDPRFPRPFSCRALDRKTPAH